MVAASPELRALLGRASAELQAGRHSVAADLYREILRRDPHNIEAIHFLGFSLVRSGRSREGFELMRRSVALNGSEPRYPQNLAFLLSEEKQFPEAETCLREAIAANPREASLHNCLGIVLQQRGSLQAALSEYREALALGGDNADVRVNLGYALLECGRVDAAIAELRASLRFDDRNFMAHNNLGNALRAKGELEAAGASLRRAVELAPGFAYGRYNLGLVLQAQGKIEEAIDCLRAAARLQPAESGLWQKFASAIGQLRLEVPDRGWEEDLVVCLEREDVEPDNVAAPALSLLRTDPAFDSLMREAARSSRFGFAPPSFEVFRRPLFRLLLEHVIVPDVDFEALTGRLRRMLLFSAISREIEADEDSLGLACAVAQQCFLREYAPEEPADESAGVETVAGQLAACGSRPDMRCRLLLAVYGAYRPLDAMPAARELDASAAEGAFARLIRRQLVEPAEERRIRGRIPVLAASENAVSRAVRDQYERNPYPRWFRAPSFVGAYPFGIKLRMLARQLAADEVSLPDDPDILIAGCGTGRHAAIVARLHPSARIVAVDLSESSLAFAMRRCGELGISNVSFARADLLRLGGLQERFDVIECVGVLHHLEDPASGWRVLLGLLRPQGFMKIGLYSELGRRGIVAAKQIIAEHGFAPTAEGMREARKLIVSLPEGTLARQGLDSKDFYSLSGCRDLLFHEKEHRFTLDSLRAALLELRLEFLCFEFDSPGPLLLYREMFPQDAAATSLSNWGQFEARHPDTFSGMYQFWVRRSAGSGA